MPSATNPIATEVAALAIPAKLWCSASQKRSEAERFGVLRELTRAVQRDPRVPALRDLREVEHRQRNR